MKLNTFSIVAYDKISQSWGIGVASKFLAVGAVVPYARADVGAIATQSAANLSFGEQGLDLMSKGFTASDTLEQLLESDKTIDERQVGLVDADGGVATFTGKACSDWAGGIKGSNYVIQGNILEGPEVVDDMAKAYETAKGELADKLFAALSAGDHAGGDRRGKQSACLLVVKRNGSYGGYTDRYLDLRVDNHTNPITELYDLLKLHHIFFGSTEESEKVKIDQSLARDLQKILAKQGYYAGVINGEWDEQTQQSFFKFIDIENLEQRVSISEGLVDPPALAYIFSHFS
jgi:uncharacterized Ntn-hydrolase superfamily protein